MSESNSGGAVGMGTTPNATEGATRIGDSFASVDRVQSLRSAPVKGLHWSLRWLRKTWFTRPRPLKPSIVVSLSADGVRQLLARSGFAPGWPWSYNYRDEILNLRRVERLAHPSGLEWWQVHVRGYDHPTGVELTAHFEPEPRRHPRAHLGRFGLDIGCGMETLLELLDSHRIDYDWPDGSLAPSLSSRRNR